eukprot:Plantae.Rhodophyta-Hildenbrandia_rubra.ctg2371.p1 GENE.Plantae.Rhodophyta-Hildenbrandia_rubra.ctg2371~~Plantae.Rhodophyta-Hildenbrandia_rubra.ctg2371.p1  ORF type:complete len:977 (-),score=143.22 Plantae.Rhodophyta-Hildenbrandia_rubra.ctg2371:20-2950(-)
MKGTFKAKTKGLLSSLETHLSSYGFAFTLLAVYSLANLFLIVTGASREWERHSTTSYRRWAASVARGFGSVVNLNAALVILVSSRSLILFLRATPLNMVLPFDKTMPGFHGVLGVVLLISGILHCLFHWSLYIKLTLWSDGFKGGTSLFVTGLSLGFLVAIIKISTYKYIRKNHFERFYSVHIIGSGLFCILLCIHGMHYGKPESWKWVIGPVFLYSFDRLSRYMREHRSYLLLSKHAAAFQGNDVLCLRLPKIFHFKAGQYAELKVPALGRFQWHPFTIASAPHEEEMIFYVKACGDWTCALYQIFNERVQGIDDDVEVHIRGPFGSPAQHVGQFEHVLLIGGGVGATPFCSVTKAAHYWINNWITRSKNSAETSLARLNHSSLLRTPWFGRKHFSRSSRGTGRGFSIERTERDNVSSAGIKSALAARNTMDRESTGNTRKSVNWEDLGAKAVSSIKGPDDDLDSDFFAAAAEMRAKMTGDSSSSSRSTKRKTSKDNQTVTTDASFHTARASFTAKPERSSSTLLSTSSAESNETDWSQIRPSRRPTRTIQTIDTSGASTRDFSLRKSLYTILDIETVATSYSELSGGSRRSLEYLSALSAAHLEQNQSEVYKKSLGMLIGISYGSTALVKTMQIRKAHLSASVLEPEEDLSIFQSKIFLLLLFMYSVTMNMILLWLLLIRVGMAGFASAFGYLKLLDNGLGLYKSRAILAVDLLLISMIALLVAVPALLEAIQLGGIPHRGLDLFVLAPIALFGVVTDILALAGVGGRVTLFGLFNIVVVWPVLGILLCVRLIRVVGERVSLAENFRNMHSKTKSLDFIWTAAGPEDDTWLVKELIPYGEGKIVRLHRYLTRAEPREEDWMQPYDRLPVRTYYEHPNWEEVFNNTAEKSLNGSTIGVFFCGPRKMGKAIRVAAMNAMRNSIVRGLHAGTDGKKKVEEIFGEAARGASLRDEEDAGGPGNRGANVRFVFRKEKFS